MGIACSISNIGNKTSAANQPIKILVLGFSGTGKTFVVYAWSLGLSNMVTTLPTDEAMFNVEKVTTPTHALSLYLWDISGKMEQRRRSYFMGTQGLVYIVDASQPESFIRVKKDLSELLYERDLAELPLLVLANKQGLEGSMSTDELKAQLLQTVQLPPCWSVCGIRLNSQEDISQALLQLEDMLLLTLPN